MIISGCVAAAAQHDYTFNFRKTCAFRPQLAFGLHAFYNVLWSLGLQCFVGCKSIQITGPKNPEKKKLANQVI